MSAAVRRNSDLLYSFSIATVVSSHSPLSYNNRFMELASCSEYHISPSLLVSWLYLVSFIGSYCIVDIASDSVGSLNFFLLYVAIISLTSSESPW